MSQKAAPKIICVYCKKKFDRPRPTGRPPEYCGTECRAAAYRARQKAVLSYSQKHDGDVARIAKAVSARAVSALQHSELPMPARPLQLLEEVMRLERDVADLQAVAVRQAAEYGASWGDIGHVLSVSASTARNKFGDEQVAKILGWRAERGTAPGPRAPRPRTSRPTSAPGAGTGEGGSSHPALPGDPAYQLTTALSHLHRASGHTQRWLADEVGVSPSLLSLILLGRRHPKWKVVKAIAELCGADPADLRPLWEKALGIPPMVLPGPEDFLQAAASLQSALRGMWIAAASPAPDDICFQHLLLTPRRVAHALASDRPEQDLADWSFVAALTTALRGQPDDVRSLWQRMQVSFALISSAVEDLDPCPDPGSDPASPARPPASRGAPFTRGAFLQAGPERPPVACRPRGTDVPQSIRSGQNTDAVLRRLDVLQAITSAGAPVGLTTLARSSGLPARQTTEVIAWLRAQHFITSHTDGGHSLGPILRAVAAGHDVVQEFLEQLSQQTRGAIYIGAYVDGDIHVSHEAAQPGIPTVDEYVDFRECAHASAVGKANLAQLRRDARLDHLSRYRPVKLTAHTITRSEDLFRSLDLAPLQYDFEEYSEREVCAASPLILPGKTACIAVAVPATERRRLNQAASSIKNRSAAMALSLILCLDVDARSRRTAQQGKEVLCRCDHEPPLRTTA
ncbi:helix-turn-helix domain-containing protein [Streptomyces sp. NPDC058655]|uniref:helix-turn-helix domain-containing protein n=1 Tax=Streptomyces sp. NPDC058655 TaxID=3346577 RepID=UPI00365ABF27